MVRVRFAPSPTGPLHIGGVRTALYNYLFTKKNKGTFILRIEDTDQKRYVPGAEQYIIDSLTWCGITFDEGPHLSSGEYAPYRQSERKGMYKQYAEDLVKKGFAYYAYDTDEDLDNMRKRLEMSKMLPKYDAVSRSSMVNSLTLPADEVQKRLAANEDVVIRLKLPRNEDVRFFDEIRGWVVINTTQMDDKVLLKSDGMPTYHLANVVDDYLMKITHVIRGEEWLPSAPLHVLLYRYFGWEDQMPVFAHLPLLLKPDGNGKLSKRDGDRLGFPVFPLQWQDPITHEISSGYKEVGYESAAVLNMLALLGWHTADNRELFSLPELIDAFELSRVNKSGAKFDLQKAYWFNQQYVNKLPIEEIADRIRPIVKEKYPKYNEHKLNDAIALMKEKAVFVKDFFEKAPYLFHIPAAYDMDVITKKWNAQTFEDLNNLLLAMQSIEDFSAISIENLVTNYAQKNNQKPTQYFQPLRISLTGEAGGPPLFELMNYLGKAESCNRLSFAINKLKNHLPSEL